MVEITGDVPKPKGGRRVRAKGARGESEIKHAFIKAMAAVEHELWKTGDLDKAKTQSEHVKRNSGQSDRGGHDLVGIPGLSVEVKFCETLALAQWWQQCERQADKARAMPVLFYRQSRQPWRVRCHTVLHAGDEPAVWVVSDISDESFLAWYALFYRRYLLTSEI